MDQLELRVYPKDETAEVLSVNINDSDHFARDVKRKLMKWGYGFDYTKSAVTILSKPETPIERLKELLYRGFGIDVQINAVKFACFVAAFSDIPGFNSMPWAKRESSYNAYYSIWVSFRTMQNWMNWLKDLGIVTQQRGSTAWRTYYDHGLKKRELVGQDGRAAMEEYYKKRQMLVEQLNKGNIEKGMTADAAKKAAWDETYKVLWDSYGCCYYWCKNLVLSAFSEKGIDVREVYELISEIRDRTIPIR